MLQINNKAESYTVTRFQINDVKYIMVPVVMIREGVHNGSGGALLYNKSELEKSVQSWEQVPVTIGHPQADGNFISANSAGVRHVGRVTNPRMSNDKLMADIVFEESLLQNESATVLAALNSAGIIEVSVGVYSGLEEKQGVWNGENYTAITKDYKPDHLAILPHEKGACSIDDGCGIRNNIQNMQTEKEKHKSLALLKITVNQSLTERIEAVSRAVNALDGKDDYHWIEDVHNDYVIYRKSGMDRAIFQKQTYEMQSDGTAKLTGTPIQVTKTVSYNVINNNKGEKQMNEEKVNALIANSKGLFTNCDKEWLLTQSEQRIAEITANPNKWKKENTIQALKGQMTFEEALELVPDAEKAIVTNAIAAEKQRKEIAIDAIIANTGNVWVKEDLQSMSTEMVDKIAASIQKQTATVVAPTVHVSTPAPVSKTEIKPL